MRTHVAKINLAAIMDDKERMSSYLLKISLRGTTNLIWRRVVVPSFLTLNQLHEVLQTSMGWQRRAEHVFFLRKQAYVPHTLERSDALPEEMFSLDDLVYQSTGKLKYVYDPGEAKWTHEIAVESVRYVERQVPFPIFCLEGIRACPPEICLGPTDYADFLKAITNPKHPRHDELRDGFSDFNPNRFDIDAVNEKLLKNGKDKGKFAAFVAPANIGIATAGKVGRQGGEIRIAKETLLEKKVKSEPIDPLHRLGQILKKKAAS